MRKEEAPLLEELRTINDRIGTGFSSIVSLVEDPKSKRKFALKTREIELQQRIDHPNVIKLYQVYRLPAKLHLLLEYAPNGSVFQYMRKNRNLTDPQISFLFKGICEGIKAAHSLSILHRDLKPENILFDAEYNPKIADFGFACEILAGERRRTICGTREYFSPEIFIHRNQTLSLDIWCLGVLLFEFCHNRTPFQIRSKSFGEAAQELKNQNYSVHPEIKETIASCLKYEPMERPSISELLKFRMFGMSAKNGNCFKMKRESMSQSRANGYNRNISKQPFMKNIDIIASETTQKFLKNQKDVIVKTNHTSKTTLKNINNKFKETSSRNEGQKIVESRKEEEAFNMNLYSKAQRAKTPTRVRRVQRSVEVVRKKKHFDLSMSSPLKNIFQNSKTQHNTTKKTDPAILKRRVISGEISLEQSKANSQNVSNYKRQSKPTEMFPYGFSNVNSQNLSFPSKTEHQINQLISSSSQQKNLPSNLQNSNYNQVIRGARNLFQSQNNISKTHKTKLPFEASNLYQKKENNLNSGFQPIIPRDSRNDFNISKEIYQQKETTNKLNYGVRFESRNRFNMPNVTSGRLVRDQKYTGNKIKSNQSHYETKSKVQRSEAKPYQNHSNVREVTNIRRSFKKRRDHSFNKTCGPLQLKDLGVHSKRNQSLKTFGHSNKQNLQIRVNPLNISDNQLRTNKNHTKLTNRRRGTPQFRLDPLRTKKKPESSLISSLHSKQQQTFIHPSQSKVIPNKSLKIQFSKPSTRVITSKHSEKVSRAESKDIMIYRRDEKTGELVGKDNRTIVMEPKREYIPVKKPRAISRDFGKGSSGKVLRKRGVSQEIISNRNRIMHTQTMIDGHLQRNNAYNKEKSERNRENKKAFKRYVSLNPSVNRVHLEPKDHSQISPPITRNRKHIQAKTTHISRNLTPELTKRLSAPRKIKTTNPNLKKNNISNHSNLGKQFIKVEIQVKKKKKNKKKRKPKKFVIDSKDLGEFYNNQANQTLKSKRKSTIPGIDQEKLKKAFTLPLKENLRLKKKGKKQVEILSVQDPEKFFAKSVSLKETVFQSDTPVFKHLIQKPSVSKNKMSRDKTGKKKVIRYSVQDPLIAKTPSRKSRNPRTPSKVITSTKNSKISNSDSSHTQSDKKYLKDKKSKNQKIKSNSDKKGNRNRNSLGEKVKKSSYTTRRQTKRDSGRSSKQETDYINIYIQNGNQSVTDQQSNLISRNSNKSKDLENLYSIKNKNPKKKELNKQMLACTEGIQLRNKFIIKDNLSNKTKKEKIKNQSKKRNTVNNSGRVLFNFGGKNFVQIGTNNGKNKNFDLRNLEIDESIKFKKNKQKKLENQKNSEVESKKINQKSFENSKVLEQLKEKKLKINKKKNRRRKTESQNSETNKKKMKKKKTKREKRLPKGNLELDSEKKSNILKSKDLIKKTLPIQEKIKRNQKSFKPNKSNSKIKNTANKPKPKRKLEFAKKLQIDISGEISPVKLISGSRLKTMENLFSAEKDLIAQDRENLSTRLSIQNFAKKLPLKVFQTNLKETVKLSPIKKKTLSKVSTKDIKKIDKILPSCKSRSISQKITAKKNHSISKNWTDLSHFKNQSHNRLRKIETESFQKSENSSALKRLYSDPVEFRNFVMVSRQNTKSDINLQKNGIKRLKDKKHLSSSYIKPNNIKSFENQNNNPVIAKRIAVRKTVGCNRNISESKNNLERLLKIETEKEHRKSQNGRVHFKPKIIKKTDLNYLSKKIVHREGIAQNEFSFRDKSPLGIKRKITSNQRPEMKNNPRRLKKPRHTAKAALIPNPYGARALNLEFGHTKTRFNHKTSDMNNRKTHSNTLGFDKSISKNTENFSQNFSYTIVPSGTNFENSQKSVRFCHKKPNETKKNLQRKERSHAKILNRPIVQRFRNSSQNQSRTEFKHLKKSQLQPITPLKTAMTKQTENAKVRKISISHKKGIRDSKGKILLNSTLQSVNSILKKGNIQTRQSALKNQKILSRNGYIESFRKYGKGNKFNDKQIGKEMKNHRQRIQRLSNRSNNFNGVRVSKKSGSKVQVLDSRVNYSKF